MHGDREEADTVDGRREQAAAGYGGTGIEPWFGRAPHVALRGAGLRLRNRAWETLCGARPRSVLALGLLSLGLLAAGLRGCAPAVFWTAVTGWAALLGAAFALLRHCRPAD
ncbi:hypothetical protein ABTX81_07145 [Kitasatospora sp. NPDC097605]|uniref:hypothetical protein n=1 Tax=Kitasatospora sp. NPDC097605 TaxID=3157226 RepID=UPI00331F93FD